MPESKDNELSLDELKDVNGGTSWDLPEPAGSVYNKIKGEKVQNTGEPKVEDINLKVKVGPAYLSTFKA